MDAAYQIAKSNSDLADKELKTEDKESRFQEVACLTGYQISGTTENAVIRKGDLSIELNDGISDAFLIRLIRRYLMFKDATDFKKVYIACGYTELKCGIDGLADEIQNHYQLDSFCCTKDLKTEDTNGLNLHLN